MEELMQSMTHREYLARLMWLEENWQQPGYRDYLLMQVSQEIRRVLSKKPNSIKLDHFKLRFEKPKPKQEVEYQSVEEATAWSKARWGAMLQGFKVVKQEPND